MGLCVCVCVSNKSNITSVAFVHPENSITYSAGIGGQKIVGFSLKPLGCRDPALPPLKAIRTVGHFPAESVHGHSSLLRCKQPVWPFMSCH